MANSERPIINLKSVLKVFTTRSGTTKAVEQLNLSVNAREFVALLGPSGCGKSTTLSIIAGLLPPTSGIVEVLQQPVSGPVTNLGMVFQHDVLMPWRSVLANVLLIVEIRHLRKADYQQRALDLLKSVGLAGFENRLPRELSGGMRQRVSIVRALLNDPPLLLMDEPFGALDAMTRDQMNLDLLDIWQVSKKTVLFVTHSITEAVFLADRVLIMSPRPATIRVDIPIHLGRPRSLALRDAPEFGRYTKQVREVFEGMGMFKRLDQNNMAIGA
jgi:NitT/TauT family transport system ATP-binding protein